MYRFQFFFSLSNTNLWAFSSFKETLLYLKQLSIIRTAIYWTKFVHSMAPNLSKFYLIKPGPWQAPLFDNTKPNKRKIGNWKRQSISEIDLWSEFLWYFIIKYQYSAILWYIDSTNIECFAEWDKIHIVKFMRIEGVKQSSTLLFKQ